MSLYLSSKGACFAKCLTGSQVAVLLHYALILLDRVTDGTLVRMYIFLGKNEITNNARSCAMVRITHESNFLPLSHLSHLSVNLVQGVSQLHQSLL